FLADRQPSLPFVFRHLPLLSACAETAARGYPHAIRTSIRLRVMVRAQPVPTREAPARATSHGRGGWSCCVPAARWLTRVHALFHFAPIDALRVHRCPIPGLGIYGGRGHQWAAR